jgi:hypothetical protein
MERRREETRYWVDATIPERLRAQRHAISRNPTTACLAYQGDQRPTAQGFEVVRRW